MTGMREAIGETEFEMQQILGYAPIEPDGSFKLTVPADTPIGLAVVDDRGPRVPDAHQLDPGPAGRAPHLRRLPQPASRRRASTPARSSTRRRPASRPRCRARTSRARRWPARARASTRTRCKLVNDLVFSDYWADTTKPGVTARPSIALKYTGNANPADDLVTAVPTNGIVNYPTHVAPLWTRNRGANTCTGCHNDPDKLDLSASISAAPAASSRTRSCMLGDPLIDPVTGLPHDAHRGRRARDRSRSGAGRHRWRAKAMRSAWRARAASTRSCPASTLMAGADARAAHPNPPATAPDHSKMLNAAEKRVLAEFIDLGGKYFNDPFDPAANVRHVDGPEQATFEKDVLPILTTTCAASCHQAIGSSMSDTPIGTIVPQQPLRADRRCGGRLRSDAVDDLERLQRGVQLPAEQAVDGAAPATRATPQTTAVLPIGSANYNTIASWISTGC